MPLLEMLMQLRNHLDVVKLILEEDPAFRVTGSKNSDLKSLISLASREGYNDIVKTLCEKYEAGKKTVHTGHFLLLEAIKGRDKELVYALLKYDEHLATHETYAKWTALHYAAFYNFDRIIDAIVKAQENVYWKPMYGAKVETPLILAANRGYTSTVILLMELLPALSCVAVNHKLQNILHIAVVQSNKVMIQSILAYCPKSCTNQILNAKDENGNTPLHLLISQGCFVKELIKHKGVDFLARNHEKWTPSDMLYFQNEVIADQAEIKKLLDDTQATERQKFWNIITKRRSNNPGSLVPSSTRWLKNVEFQKRIKELRKKEIKEMKDELERYRGRTTTQIVVTAVNGGIW